MTTRPLATVDVEHALTIAQGSSPRRPSRRVADAALGALGEAFRTWLPSHGPWTRYRDDKVTLRSWR